MRSVVVVFPASICAMIPMLRRCSSGVCLGIYLVLGRFCVHVGEPTVRPPGGCVLRENEKRGSDLGPHLSGRPRESALPGDRRGPRGGPSRVPTGGKFVPPCFISFS